MERTFEELLVEQCAPTLAGLKPASLFRYQAADRLSSIQTAARWARELAPFGLTLRILRVCPETGAVLLYLYRKGEVCRLLAEPGIRAFLEASGYRTEEGCPGVLRQLSQRLCRGTEFPHEIGVVLGYPLEDVVGFIRHRGRDFTCSGCWKCYGDAEAARRRFASYRRCTAYCLQQLRQGVAVTRMIAA